MATDGKCEVEKLKIYHKLERMEKDIAENKETTKSIHRIATAVELLTFEQKNTNKLLKENNDSNKESFKRIHERIDVMNTRVSKIEGGKHTNETLSKIKESFISWAVPILTIALIYGLFRLFQYQIGG